MAVAKKEHKLDIWAVLKAADQGDLNFYSNLSDDQKKEFIPYVLMRWMSAVNNTALSEHYITTTNSFINIGFWELVNHPELQWKLFAACGAGITQRHAWIPNSKKTSTSKLNRLLCEFNPSLNDTELHLIKQKLTKESLKQLCLDYAMDNSEIKLILEDFKKFTESNNALL